MYIYSILVIPLPDFLRSPGTEIVMGFSSFFNTACCYVFNTLSTSQKWTHSCNKCGHTRTDSTIPKQEMPLTLYTAYKFLGVTKVYTSLIQQGNNWKCLLLKMLQVHHLQHATQHTSHCHSWTFFMVKNWHTIACCGTQFSLLIGHLHRYISHCDWEDTVGDFFSVVCIVYMKFLLHEVLLHEELCYSSVFTLFMMVSCTYWSVPEVPR